MKAIILLNYDENTKMIEAEEKIRFLRSILEQMGLPIEEFWSETEDFLSIFQKMKLRNILNTYNIQVIDNNEGLSIFMEGDKIAEWFRPNYKLKKDFSQLDPKKKLFLEMTIEFWSVFEENIQQGMEIG